MIYNPAALLGSPRGPLPQIPPLFPDRPTPNTRTPVPRGDPKDESYLQPLPTHKESAAKMTNDKLDRSFLDADVHELVKQMTLPEKVSLLAGKDWWK